MNKILDKIKDKVKGTDAVNDLIENKDTSNEVTIELVDLGNGAVAETMPEGTILIDKQIGDEVDDYEASRLVHELSHHVDFMHKNYLDDLKERRAFEAQIQYLIEQGHSDEEIYDMLMPIFDDYKSPKNAEKTLLEMMEKAKQK